MTATAAFSVDSNKWKSSPEKYERMYCQNCSHLKALHNGAALRIGNKEMFPEGRCTWSETWIREPHDENDEPVPQIISKSEILRCECMEFVGKGHNSVIPE
jgi:hypothetical protein